MDGQNQFRSVGARSCALTSCTIVLSFRSIERIKWCEIDFLWGPNLHSAFRSEIEKPDLRNFANWCLLEYCTVLNRSSKYWRRDGLWNLRCAPPQRALKQTRKIRLPENDGLCHLIKFQTDRMRTVKRETKNVGRTDTSAHVIFNDPTSNNNNHEAMEEDTGAHRNPHKATIDYFISCTLSRSQWCS